MYKILMSNVQRVKSFVLIFEDIWIQFIPRLLLIEKLIGDDCFMNICPFLVSLSYVHGSMSVFLNFKVDIYRK